MIFKPGRAYRICVTKDGISSDPIPTEHPTREVRIAAKSYIAGQRAGELNALPTPAEIESRRYLLAGCATVYIYEED